MKYRNYEVGFSFEVPDNFSEVKQSSYEVFGVSPETMHYFICLDDDGNVIRSFSINKDEPCKSDEDYIEIIKKTLEQLDELGFHVLQNNELKTENDKIIERFVLYDENMEENLGILLYFMRVKDAVITSSCYIVEFYDEFEDELFSVFNSIKEV